MSYIVRFTGLLLLNAFIVRGRPVGRHSTLSQLEVKQNPRRCAGFFMPDARRPWRQGPHHEPASHYF